jgi:hypothetical protein
VAYLFLVRSMMARLVLAVLILSCRCFAGLPPVEGELGPPRPTPSDDDKRRWKLYREDANSDRQGDQWQFKFNAGSDKPLGTAADAAAIKALVPATVSPTIRWVSHSVVVVSSACRFDASSSHPQRCLYVFEKHGSKWKLTHHYRITPFGWA